MVEAQHEECRVDEVKVALVRLVGRGQPSPGDRPVIPRLD